MTYSDKDIDKLVGWARRDALTAYNGGMVTEMADMLAQLKIDRAFLRTRADEAEKRAAALTAALEIATAALEAKP